MALMIKKYSSLRLVTLVSLPCMVIYCPSALAEIQTIAANTTSQLSASKAYNKNNKVLVPSLVGVLINGEEQGVPKPFMTQHQIQSVMSKKTAIFYLSMT